MNLTERDQILERTKFCNLWYWLHLEEEDRKTLVEGARAMLSKEDKEDAEILNGHTR